MPTKFLLTRRDFFKKVGIGGAVLASGALAYRSFVKSKQYKFSGSMVGENSSVGHLLRDGVKVNPTKTEYIDTAIVGGGISGLSAAWWLKKNNQKNFVLFEMDNEVGGNSASGESSVSRYPWGAHYVPLPGPEAHYVREFFEEVGIITGTDNGLPVYNEYYLCADPHERLYFQGQWQDGLVPQYGIQSQDKKQYSEFFGYVEQLKHQKGRDGKFAFSIPVELSSQDYEFLKFDKISMRDFMMSKGWDSQYLNWYVNYGCRDDYGMPHDKVSAWAGLHYFASRSGVAANADSQTVITWPEGNGFLVDYLKKINADQIRKHSLVFEIDNLENKTCSLKVLNTQDKSCTEYITKNVIYCGPRFAADRVIKNYKNPINLDYAPWLVANITVDEIPATYGAPLSWDNVSFYSQSLGYIVANHQDTKINRKQKVITYYLPLDEKSPKEERMAAYQKSFNDWLDIIIPDLEKMHPHISKFISNVDMLVWGHGMVSPGIDYLWSSKRQEMLKPLGNIIFAHSDMSGISIFEEAQYRGVLAAKAIIKKAGTV